MKNKILGDGAVMTASGYVSTKKGEVLTSSKALSLVRAKLRKDNAAALSKKLSTDRHVLDTVKRQEKTKTEAEKLREMSTKNRARLANMPLDTFLKKQRPLAVRRALARIRATEKWQCAARLAGQGR